jgi:hypothetical protein
MNPDDFKSAWHTPAAQGRLTIDAEILLKEVRRSQTSFTVTIFWRDVREVGGALLLVAVWLYMGAKLALPWTWYLTIPALLWIAGFMLVDRLRHSRRSHSGEPLRQCVESSLAQIEHQIWLLRNVAWWYLLPPALTMLAFVGHLAWQGRAGGWQTALALGSVAAVLVIVLAGIYWLNQAAVRCTLMPRREELRTLLANLHDETATAE